MDLDFSDLLSDFLDDNFSKGCVSNFVLDLAEAIELETLNRKNIPEGECILPPELLS